MGKHFWMKHADREKHDKQPGCIWGLAHVMGFHHSQSSNVRKWIQHHKYQQQRNDRCNWSGDCQGETLLEGNESTYLINERSQETKKRLLKAQAKSLIAEEAPVESKNREGRTRSFKRSLQRTYSIHHMEPMDIDRKRSIIFLPRDMKILATQSVQATKTEVTDDDQEASIGRSNDHMPNDVAEYDLRENLDVLEMFMVDKGLLIKRLQEAGESIATLSHSALGLTPRSILNKSRSFPLAEWSWERKPKPVKLESKYKEVWSFLRKDRFQAVNQALRSGHSSSFGKIPGELAGIVDSNNTFSGVTMDEEHIQPSNEFSMPSETPPDADSTGKKLEEYHIRKHVHRRSSSLNESLDKYVSLFENSFPADSKLNSSKSLKLANEYGYVPEYSQRKHFLAYQELCHSTSKFENFSCNNTSRNGSMTTRNDIDSSLQYDEEQDVVGETNITEICHKEPDDACKCIQTKEDDACSPMTTKDVDGEMMDNYEGEHELKKSHLLQELDTDYVGVVCEDLPPQDSILNSDLRLHEMEPCVIEHQTSNGLDHSSRIDGLKFSVGSSDLQSKDSNSPSTCGILNLDNHDLFDKTMPSFVPNICLENNDADLYYAKYLLDQSNIAVEDYEMARHAFDQPLSTELFNKVEASWPHEQNQFRGWHECGCWHHQLLFDLVNDIILDVYDASFPYYPKALSSCCRVRPFPLGNRILEGVSTDISMLMNLRKQSLDGTISHDLVHDTSWMNLQLETECVALELEDMIFDELLEDIIHC